MELASLRLLLGPASALALHLKKKQHNTALQTCLKKGSDLHYFIYRSVGWGLFLEQFDENLP